MSNEKLARQWAESRNPNSLSEDARAAREYILEHVAPQRMDEVAWSDEEHALAGAIMDIGNGPVEVIMLSVDSDGYLDYATLDGKVAHEMRYEFTPNGKRYELVEVTEHPETLTTWEDFNNAPEGTVVSSPGAVPAMKNRDGRWRAVGIITPLTSGSLALGAESPATVLRWGWGE